MNRAISLRQRFRISLGLGAFALWLSGCSLLHWGDDSPSAEQKAACGQLCLSNGEKCSTFFAAKNEEQRLLFEQAKQNFWICLKKYPGKEVHPDIPCIPPTPAPEMFDSCGQQLDQCMESCDISLDELAELTRKPAKTVDRPPPVFATE